MFNFLARAMEVFAVAFLGFMAAWLVVKVGDWVCKLIRERKGE